MKNFITILFIICLASLPLFAANGAGVDHVKTYRNSVTFDHGQHATYADCEKCHQLFPDKIVNKDRGHKACKSCHKEHFNEYPNAPVRCKGCHKK